MPDDNGVITISEYKKEIIRCVSELDNDVLSVVKEKLEKEEVKTKSQKKTKFIKEKPVVEDVENIVSDSKEATQTILELHQGLKDISGKNSTVLKYSVEAQIGGKLAQLGSRLIDSTSKKLAGKFFDNFVKIVDGTTKIEEEVK